MSIDKIESVINSTVMGSVKETARKSQPEAVKVHEDVVSIGQSENIVQIKWPPLFPIGDTQSIFKIEE